MDHVYIVAGHGKSSSGRHDPGTTGDNYLVPGTRIAERDITINVAQLVLEKLGNKATGVGITEDLTISEKTAEVKKLCKQRGHTHKNSLLCSIHVDWYKAPSGVAAYFYGGSAESEAYSMRVLEHLQDNTNMPIRWNKPDTASRFGRLGIVRDTVPLAMLAEIGSIGKDLEMIATPEGQNKVAEGIADGIRDYAGWIEEGQPIFVLPKEYLLEEATLQEAISEVSEAWNDVEKAQEKLHNANNKLRSLL